MYGIKYSYLLYQGKEKIHSEIVNYSLTEVVQSDKYYKSHAIGVTSEVGLATDRDLSELMCLRNMVSFIPLRYRKSRGRSHYKTLSNTQNRSIGSNTRNRSI